MSMKPTPEITSLNRLFFEGTAQGELRLLHCLACETKFRFTHPLCPNCWSDNLEYQVASGRGTVETFTIMHMPPYEAFAGDVPYVIALVMLEEGVRMMANIIGIAPDEVTIDMPVEVFFEQRGDVALPQFRPAG
jgi:uncharacterized protein